MTSREQTARQIVTICHRLYERGLVSATDGNVSVRMPDGSFVVTPSGLGKGLVREEDLVEIRSDGTPISGRRRPTTELGMHLFIYRERPDVAAVVHAHPPFATGFAAARRSLDLCVFPEVIVTVGAVPLAPYATPSTDEVAASIAPFVHTARAILLANHGVVTYGPTLEDAYHAMEKVEHAAHMVFVARMLGGEKALTAGELKRLQQISLEIYGKDLAKNLPCKPGRRSTRRRRKH